LGKVSALADTSSHGFDDCRVRVTGQTSTVATVHVDVVVPIDVIDLRSSPTADPDRLRSGYLPAGRHPPGKNLNSSRTQPPGLGLTIDEYLLLFFDNGFQPFVDFPTGRFSGLGDLDCHLYLSVRATPVSTQCRRLSAVLVFAQWIGHGIAALKSVELGNVRRKSPKHEHLYQFFSRF
jgi:hypothetical protein